MLAIITAIYTVYRLCCLYDRHSVKQAVGGLLQVTLWAVVGVLMSAAILLPVILTFIGDNRNGVQYPLTLLYDADFYRNFLAAYTTSHNQAYQTYLGFNAVALPAICLLYFKRKPEEKPLRILFLLATAALLIPVFGWALNGFSYMANRWVWAYSLLVAYIVTTQWQKLRHITVGQAVACVGALALYSLLTIPLMTTDTRNISVSVLLAFLIIVLCALAPKFKKKHLATALVLVLVLTSFTGNAAYFYSSYGKHKTDTFVATEKVNRRIKGASGRKVKKAAKKFSLKMAVTTVCIVLVTLVVAAGIVLGSVFGVAVGGAKRNTSVVSQEEVKQIALDYIKTELNIDEEAIGWKIERDLEMTSKLKNSYYIYEVEVNTSRGKEIELEIDGRNGKVIYVEVDRY